MRCASSSATSARAARPSERPPGNEDGESYRIGSRLRRREATLQDEQLICECELIGRRGSRRRSAGAARPTSTTSAAALRLGMGPCQGGFCIYRATGILHSVDRLDGAEAAASLRGFLQERWKGVWPILYGDQLRQARLDDWIFQGLLDVEHLPGDDKLPDDEQRARGEAVPAAEVGE